MRKLSGALAVLPALVIAAVGTAIPAAATTAPAAATVPGVAVGPGDGNVDWPALAAQGDKFAYVQATQGDTYTSPYFAQQYDGSHAAGLLHGATHFAQPDQSDGRTQADFFLANGGTWVADGATLPGVLDLEFNPYGTACYGLSQAAMVTWIQQFVTEVHTRTSRWPVIYTETGWWSECTGNDGGFGTNDPLWITESPAGSGQAQLPHGWTAVTFYNLTTGGNGAWFNGTLDQLLDFAAGKPGTDHPAGHVGPAERSSPTGRHSV